MTEFAVSAAALSLLLLGSLALAGYQEVDRRSVIAARELAWQESWVAGSVANSISSADLHGRVYADSGVLDPHAQALLVAEGDVHASAERRSPEGVAGGVSELMLAPLRAASGFLGSGFDLTESGLVSGMVEARIAPLSSMPDPFDTLELPIRVPFALLADGWNAGGISHVERRASGLVPTGRLSAVSGLWSAFSTPLRIIEPSLGRLCLGLIEPDRIPEDRLGPGRTPPPGACP